jgi:23S rRNA (uracil1939-C5)-methyltransferase
MSVERLTPWDMIPLSLSVESLAILKPSAPPAPRILYQDETCLAIERPPFTHLTLEGDRSSAGLLRRVRELPGCAEAELVPGLEPEASGICLVARRAASRAELARALLAGKKSYLALVRGIARPKGRIERTAPGGHAATRYRRERVVGTHSLIRAFAEPGQRSQLRPHLASIGHPVLGDDVSGDEASNRYFDERHGLDRPFLHCARVELELAAGSLSIESELAPDLAATLTSLDAPASVELDEAPPSGQ